MKIALVELSESHEECMYSQVSFLVDAGHEVSLIIHPKIDVESYKELATEIVRYDFDTLPKMHRFPLQLKLVRHLKPFDKIIFNTASSSKSLRNVVFLLKAYKTECIGVIHNVKKLNNSFTQKVISSKIKKYLTLSDTLKNHIKLKDQRLKLESFYPIFFPSTEKVKLNKKKNDVWICIPGRVFYNRRDYQFLIEKLSKITIPKNLKFVILGNINNQDGLRLKQELESNQISDAFIIFEKFIPNNLYYGYLEHSDFIMPLLQHQDKDYIDSKITGSFNMAYGFKKPLLFHEFYAVLPDLKSNGISYNDNNFEQIINAITTKTAKIPSLYQDEKWSYAYQQKKYINFINS